MQKLENTQKIIHRICRWLEDPETTTEDGTNGEEKKGSGGGGAAGQGAKQEEESVSPATVMKKLGSAEDEEITPVK